MQRRVWLPILVAAVALAGCSSSKRQFDCLLHAPSGQFVIDSAKHSAHQREHRSDQQ